MIDIQSLSKEYSLRSLDDSHVDEILDLCRGNELYYQYCEAQISREQILSDLRIAPPGTPLSRKHYIGFYREEALLAVMDLIEGYPEDEMAYIGFFMVAAGIQGQGVGSQIIRDAEEYLREMGIRAIRIGIDKGNPQSTGFWKKNGFQVIKEVDRKGHGILVAEKGICTYESTCYTGYTPESVDL